MSDTENTTMSNQTDVDLTDGMFDFEESEDVSNETPEAAPEDTTESNEENLTTEEPDEEESKETTEDSDVVRFKCFDEVKLLNKKAVADVAKSLDVTPDDVLALLQKGRAYEPMKQKYAQLDEFATSLGKAPGEVLKELAVFREQKERSDAMEEARRQYPNAPEEMLNDIVSAKMEQRAIQEATRQKAEIESIRAQEDQVWVDAFQKSPELLELAKKGETPDMVRNFNENGFATPFEAWSALQIQRLENDLKTTTRKSEVKQKSVGSATGEIGSPKEPSLEDSFYSGWA